MQILSGQSDILALAYQRPHQPAAFASSAFDHELRLCCRAGSCNQRIKSKQTSTQYTMVGCFVSGRRTNRYVRAHRVRPTLGSGARTLLAAGIDPSEQRKADKQTAAAGLQTVSRLLPASGTASSMGGHARGLGKGRAGHSIAASRDRKVMAPDQRRA